VSSHARQLPPALPPAERTVGQLVAETIRLYGSRFWASLAVGVLPAALTIGVALAPRNVRFPLSATLVPLLLGASYVLAVCIATSRRPPARVLAVAYACAVVAFVPVPFLVLLFVLPALAWLAYVGLAVPAAVLEELGFRDSLRRGIQLARADYVHALGSLATLAIVAFLSQSVLFFLLRGAGGAALWAASFLADLVIAPLVLLGFALLYEDQAARVSIAPPQRGGA
jgi:hypothetical protein